MRIKWVNPSHSLQPTIGNLQSNPEDYTVHMNPGYYILKSYYKYKSPENYKKLEWLEPHFKPLFNEDMEEVLKEDIDVLCLSFFIWNFSALSRLAKRFKEIRPDIIIIAGGPQLDAHKRFGFFEEHPYIDYVVYGDGEDAFASILDATFAKTEIPTTSVNIITKDKKYPHRVFSDKEFWNRSYILDLKEEIEYDVYRILKHCKGIKLDWEIDRGCPYKCSFCDWSSGLHHKVKRRSKHWKEEMEFMSKLPVDVKLINANFGIFEEDLEIAQYISDHKIQNVKILYMAKLHKERTWKIQEILALNNKNYIASVALQDIDEEILGNIDRPAISWEEEKEYAIQFHKKYPEHVVWFIVMIGLPGQTVETFKYMLLEIHNLGIKSMQLGSYHWHLLYNSPAHDPAYQEKYKVVFEEFFLPTVSHSGQFTEDLSFEELNRLYEEGSPFATKVKLAKETYSANWLEMIKMITLVGIFSGIKNVVLNIDPSRIFFNPAFDRFLEEESLETLNSMERNRLWGKWCPEEKKWFSIDSYYHRNIFIKKFLERFN